MSRRVVVLKFGGSVLAGDRCLSAVLEEIRRPLDGGAKVVAVVSAQGDETVRLMERATDLAAEPDDEALAALLATGELRSAAILAVAASAAGVRTVVGDARRLGLRTCGPSLRATPVGLATRVVGSLLQAHDLLVVPGFVGIDAGGRPTLLGRGGSDSTAVFVAHRLRAASCALIKDVDGWYVSDPRRSLNEPARFRRLRWDDALAHPAPIVQERAVALARELDRPFEVRALGSHRGTRVGPERTCLESKETEGECEPLRPSRGESRGRMETRLVQRPSIPGEPSGARSTPIYQTATFTLGRGGWDYSRSGNPTRDVLEAQLASLDGAEHALAYSSGMAAVAGVLRCVEPGGTIAVGRELYGGTFRLLERWALETGVEVRFLTPGRPAEIASQLTGDTRMVWIETPTNPRLDTWDVPAVAAAARARGALLAVDNSMLSPLYQRPLELGADFAVQSATKSLGGHGDLTAGVVAVRREELARRLDARRNAEGTALAPFDSWLLLRGLETLAVRLPRQIESAERLAAAAAGHPALVRLHHAKDCGVLTLELADAEAARRFAAASRWFRTAVSFGGVSSSLDLPHEMSHASVPPRWRAVQALPDGLVRLSVGLECADDLVADVRRALDGIESTRERRASA